MVDDKSSANVQRTFSLYGLTITRALSVQVHKFLQTVEPQERESWLTRIMDHIFQKNPGSSQVTSNSLAQAIAECKKPEAMLQDTETVFNVIDTFHVPKVVFHPGRKKFVLEKVNPDLYPEVSHKSSLFKHRLQLLWHRTLRHEDYTPLNFGEDNAKYTLTPLEYLLSESKPGKVRVMGLLSQLTQGQYYLEDIGGSIKIDLTKANFKAGLIMEGCIVIAEGVCKEGVFQITEIDFPPAELSVKSREPFDDVNTFGGGHPSSLKISKKLKTYEKANSEASIVFVSEFWVDSTRVLEKFEAMLDAFKEFPPVAFVLCGHFLSFSPNPTSPQKMKNGFARLAEIIERYPNIKQNSKFVLVPGPYDLGSPKILPRDTLPDSLLRDFIKRIPGTILATNPCRIQYCTKEIVVFREDMFTKLCRNTLKFPTENKIYDHFAQSIIRQSHLCPLSMPVIPIYWKHDHALQLFPTPDLIVVADKFAAYTTSYNDCQVINPGPFARNFSFRVYEPSTNTIEDCDMLKEDDNV